MIKFSIIVPIYNVEKYLLKCLDSLVNQTYSNIEIICINDGSPDNSLQILEEYASKDNRIKIINQENQGLSGARNTGLKNVTGDYVLFIDADDWLELNSCEILHNTIKNYGEVDVIQYQYKMISKKNIDYSEKHFKDNEMFFALDRLEKFFGNCPFPTCWNKTYRYEFLKQKNIIFPGNVKACFEDVIFGVNLYRYNPKILVINDYLYNYYQDNQNSICKSDFYKKLQLHKIAFDSLQELLEKVNNDELKNIAYDYYLININHIFTRLCLTKHKNECIEELKIARNSFDKKYKCKSIKFCNFYLILVKFHLVFIYFKLIRPIGKNCIVLPYRRFREFLRS